jgi:hypothetical protein
MSGLNTACRHSSASAAMYAVTVACLICYQLQRAPQRPGRNHERLKSEAEHYHPNRPAALFLPASGPLAGTMANTVLAL